MKKSFGGILGFLSLISLASAGPVEGVDQLLTGLGDVVALILQFISGLIFNTTYVDEIIFAKLLLLAIILIVVYTVIKKVPTLGDNTATRWIVAVGVAILSVRYIPEDFIRAILLQYSTLGVALTIFIPLIIFFFFIHESGLGYAGRRFGWLIFIISFMMLWAFSDNLGDANWIYWIGIIFAIFALVFDTRIHRYFHLADFRKRDSRIKEREKYHLEDELDKWGEWLRKEIIKPEKYDEESKRIRKRIKELSK